MGLDKRKPILITNFNINPFDSENRKLSSISKSSMPTVQDDVVLAKHENVYYSVQYVLNKLLDNDKYIKQYLEKSNDLTDGLIEPLTQALSSSITSEQIANTTSDISGVYASKLERHIEEYHDNSNSDFCPLSSITTDYLKNDMSNFDADAAKTNFQKTSHGNVNLSAHTNITISNDVVVEVEFDDSSTVRSPTNYVNVLVSNEKTDYQFRTTMTKSIATLETIPNLTECKYIYKRWLSGLKELYIYLPTTYTFYNEHTPDQYGNEEPDKKATFIRVGINKRHFNLNHIYQAHICGQSLPMQIHADKNPYFSDVILPSMLRSMCLASGNNVNTTGIYDNKTSMYYLYFICYGTDSQAIRIFAD